eukprot:TRINITY_DN7813_c0_g2_i1.p1 TRINITY_DN7813_c0_g2~~TRINITY_DN7813_c0_g2_i1.p1  ORF type:complete len:827 (-),score=114.84 TRINITY_DN7813_c0_g2_i1:455-2935(-)
MRGSCWSSFLCLLVAASLVAVSTATVEEGRILLSIASQWQNSNFLTWKEGGDPCLQKWENVTCDANGFVVELNVSNRALSGQIPKQIGDLTNLQILDVGNIGGDRGANMTNKNQFQGPVPEELANLTSLTVLNLSSIFWNMPFPEVVTRLPNLEEFQIAEANLTGEIPKALYQLKKLRTLYIGGNQLQADLKDISTLTALTELTFWGSNLNQTIPPDFANLTQLTFLNMHSAGLFGGLPESMGSMSMLNNLQLYDNTLTGRFPDSWKNLKNMFLLRMDSLFLSGPFPQWLLTDLPKLTSLYLTDNQFYSDMPSKDMIILGNFSLLRIDCNYMNGTDPYSGSPPPNFRTRYNCFTNAIQSDLDNVRTKCHASHNNLDCSTLYELVKMNKCPTPPKYQFVLSGNPAWNPCVCGYTGGPGSKGSGVPVGGVIGGVLGLFVIFLIILGFILWKRREHFSLFDKFKVKREEDLGDWEVPPGVERFTVQELARITGNFSDANVIGAGGFGKVFYGTLDDGRVVAIKRASATSMQGASEFRNEITLLSRLHHRHLVRLEGFCEEQEIQILVYEFMKRGNLHSHLLGKITSTPLHWYKRLEIAVGVAQGLEYLHSFADPPVIHRDVKPSNILLDDNMVAKLADFGISKATAEFDTHVSTRPAGTAGYLDPEYFLRRQLTTASDVYAFGVVLLELVTGQEAIDHKRHDEYNLIEWTKKRYNTSGLRAIIDPLIENEYSSDAYNAMTELGLQCTSFNKDERPSMKVVLATLEPHLAVQSMYGKAPAPKEEPVHQQKPLPGSSDPNRKQRPIHITFESEYMDTSVPEVQEMYNLGPR